MRKGHAPTAPFVAHTPKRDGVCPFLGLADDPNTHFTFAARAHRCHAKRSTPPVDHAYQREYCLTTWFVECPRFLDSRPPVLQADRSPPPSQG